MQLSWWWPGNPQNSQIVLGNPLNDSFNESVDDLGVKYFHDHGTNHGCFGMMEVGVKKLFLLVLRWLAGNGKLYWWCLRCKVHFTHYGSGKTVFIHVLV